jgi:GTP cyclohydrolase I
MIDQDKIREAVKMIIEAIGEDSSREAWWILRAGSRNVYRAVRPE